ncbi:hypothetical protein IAQ61_004513 [Plenodomus lingam]|uniref:uncharacterized protein n=1 Tax=Leptosphaeria maculans TaxID=5022 RepID=UPI00331B1E91|nr:hypothetical protein IAQ61_004513 [Plenodomus lingam]
MLRGSNSLGDIVAKEFIEILHEFLRRESTGFDKDVKAGMCIHLSHVRPEGSHDVIGVSCGHRCEHYNHYYDQPYESLFTQIYQNAEPTRTRHITRCWRIKGSWKNSGAGTRRLGEESAQQNSRYGFFTRRATNEHQPC